MAVVGAWRDDDQGNNSGSAYVYRYDPGTTLTWVEEQKLTASDMAFGWDFFGGSVSVSGDVAVVGAPGDDDLGDNSGSAYLFDLGCSSAPEFIRGDCNDDSLFDIGDPIFLLSELFSGGDPANCDDACDMNDDGLKDIGDPDLRARRPVFWRSATTRTAPELRQRSDRRYAGMWGVLGVSLRGVRWSRESGMPMRTTIRVQKAVRKSEQICRWAFQE